MTQLKLNTLSFHNIYYVSIYECWYLKKVTKLKLKTASY